MRRNTRITKSLEPRIYAEEPTQVAKRRDSDRLAEMVQVFTGGAWEERSHPRILASAMLGQTYFFEVCDREMI